MNISLTLALLLGLGGVLPAAATDYAASDYLPLAVGNSWTYEHDYADREADYSQWSTYMDQAPSQPQFTIRVERTEGIDGKTYFVISDMPDHWPPAPPHFIAGRKLRWEGTHLMERTGDGEQAIFRFDGTTANYTPVTDFFFDVLNFRFEGSNVYKTEYGIPEVAGDNRVKLWAGLEPVPWYSFSFHGNGEGERWCGFLYGYGSNGFDWRIAGFDVSAVFRNEVRPLRAVIGGSQVEFPDALIPTSSSSSSSWGRIKNTFLAHDGRTSP